jgi:serine/threonine protein kinase
VGAFGKVYLAKHRSTKNVCAIKSLSKGQLLEARLHKHVLQERDVMRDVADSRHTVRLLGTFQDSTKLYVCTEVIMGGELFNRLARVGGAVTEKDAAFYAACVVLGLQYMQRKHYVYRDLKPENLLVDESGYVKIADFGFAKRLPPGERAFTLCGTPEYMAPELFKQTGHDKGVDWWALGVLAYEMVLGSPPFYSPNGDGASQMRRVLSGKYAFPKGAQRTSAAFEDFVKETPEPELREAARVPQRRRRGRQAAHMAHDKRRLARRRRRHRRRALGASAAQGTRRRRRRLGRLVLRRVRPEL